jgi:hypothetical protein
MTHAIRPVDFDNLQTMTYKVSGRVARITFNRPEKGNAIVADTPLELSALVERADLDPNVHVILVSGRGKGFCAGFDLSAYAEGSSSAGGGGPYKDTVLSGKTQAINHLPDQPWDPMIDYQMMSRFVRGFSSLLHADKPTVVKIHGYCVAGGTDIALHADQIIAAADLLARLPGTVVFDHLGRLSAAGIADPAFGVIRRMLDKGNTWMKISGAYMFDDPPRYPKAKPIAQAYVAAASERMVWGSDWPHPTEQHKPDDAALFDLLSDWITDAATRQRILVDNPATLYGFPK